MAESQIELPARRDVRSATWPRALAWGFGVALVHRVVLGLWLALMWVTADQWLHAPVNFHDPHGLLPPLTTTADQLIFGVWRRWDAVHYLDLAVHGYQTANPGPTVFGVLAPWSFRLADVLLPGSIDLAALVVETLAFAVVLTLLYRLCEVYYDDAELAPWAVVTLALMPLSFLFASPLSESLFLACVLGLFYFGAKDRWFLAAVCGFLATLTRSQGAILMVIGAVLLLERQQVNGWRERLIDLVRRGWPLALMPLGALAFLVYRQQLGLPPVNQVYADYSYVFFVNPIEGLWINLRWIVAGLPGSLINLDNDVLLLTLVLTALLLRSTWLRRPAATLYVVVSVLIFVSKINWFYNTHTVMSTQSFARYTVVLWPLALMIAGWLRQAKPWGRVAGVGLLGMALLALSLMNLLALAGP